MLERGFVRGLVAIAALGIAAAAAAQGGAEPAAQGGAEPAAQGGGEPPAAEPGLGVGIAGAGEARWLERNAKELGLDEKTLAEVKKLGDQARETARRHQEELREGGKRLSETFSEEMPNAAALEKQAAAIGRIWTQALEDRLHTSMKLRELLTPEQRKKAAELRRKPLRRGGRP